MDRADTLDAEAMLSLRALIVDLQERVLARISTELTDGRADQQWGAWWIPRLIRSIDTVLNDISVRAGGILGGFLADAWQIGSDLVEKPSRAAYPQLEVLPPAINFMTLTTIAPFSAQLITNVSETTREVVNQAIRTNVVLGESPFKLMQALAASPLDRGPWKTLAYRTELITRTELSRAQTMASTARLEQAVLESPGLIQGPSGLKQIFTSVQIGEWPCKICRPLDGTVWEIDDPRKPVPPMHPACRCMLSPFFPGISKVRTVPDIPSGRQRKASVVECGCCG